MAWRTTTELRVRAHRATYVVHALPEDYALVVVGPRFSFTVSPRALRSWPAFAAKAKFC